MPNTLPDLDEPCGEHFVYRDLIECGESWKRLAAQTAAGEPIDNVPRVAETFEAMRRLCAEVLDPVKNHFGKLELTYAFASPQLTKHIDRRIAPALDQHAGNEVSSVGLPICRRLGMAADLIVPGIDSREVARWIVRVTAFDRLYFYESGSPLHVSVGPGNSRQVVHMHSSPSGRRVPRVMRLGSL